MFPDTFRPRWTSPLARTKGESAEPDLWPALAVIPILGASGSLLPDVAGFRQGVNSGGLWTPEGLDFDGATTYAYVPDVNQRLSPGNITVVFSASVSSAAATSVRLFDKKASWAALSGWHIERSTTTTTMVWFGSGGSDTHASMANMIVYDTMTAYAVRKLGTNVRGYRNGVNTHDITVTDGTMAQNNLNLRIARGDGNPGVRYADMTLGYAYVYPRCLSASEIARLHADPYRFLRPRRTTGWVPLAFNLRTHATAKKQESGVNTISVNLDTSAGANRVAGVIVRAYKSDGLVEVTSVTVGGQQASKIVDANFGGGS